MIKINTVAAVAALAAAATMSSVGAQNLPTGLISGISQQCLGSLAGLLGNQDLNSCMALTPAITTFGGLSRTDSVVPAVNSFLTSNFCPANVCQNSTLMSANTTLNQGCSKEIMSGSNILVIALEYLINDYTAIKTASCYEDTSANNQNCVSQTLTNVQSNIKTNLSIDTISMLTNSSSNTQLMQAEMALLSNKTFLCTNCNKELFQTLAPALQLNQSTQMALQGNVSQQCGASFLTSKPSDLKQTGKVNSTGGSGGSGSSSSTTGNGAGINLPGAATAAAALLAAGIALVA